MMQDMVVELTKWTTMSWTQSPYCNQFNCQMSRMNLWQQFELNPYITVQVNTVTENETLSTGQSDSSMDWWRLQSTEQRYIDNKMTTYTTDT